MCKRYKRLITGIYVHGRAGGTYGPHILYNWSAAAGDGSGDWHLLLSEIVWSGFGTMTGTCDYIRYVCRQRYRLTLPVPALVDMANPTFIF